MSLRRKNAQANDINLVIEKSCEILTNIIRRRTIENKEVEEREEEERRVGWKTE